MIERDFQLTFDADLVKGDTENAPWIIKGIASVEIPDLQNETLIVKGMEIDYLADHGLINWNHLKGPQHILGEITKAEKILKSNPAKLYVEGMLYKHQPQAIAAYELMKALEDSEGSRKMRFSVEGKALERVNKRKITKSWITSVALTMQPVNTHPAIAAVLAKGFCMHPESELCLECSQDCIAKALTVDSPSGKALTRESLEGASHKCTGTCTGNCKKKEGDDNQLTKSRALQIITSKGYSVSTAEYILDTILRQGGMK